MVPFFRLWKNSSVSGPVAAGKKGTLWATMSVCRRRGVAASTKRSPSPRGLPLASVSGSCGMPVDDEKRAITGRRGAGEVLRLGELARLGRRLEGPREEDALGVGCDEKETC